MNVKIARLVGEKRFIIGEEIETGDFNDCFELVIARQGADKWTIALTEIMAPFGNNAIARQKVDIRKKHILATSTASDELTKEYIQITTGLIIPA